MKKSSPVGNIRHLWSWRNCDKCKIRLKKKKKEYVWKVKDCRKVNSKGLKAADVDWTVPVTETTLTSESRKNTHKTFVYWETWTLNQHCSCYWENHENILTLNRPKSKNTAEISQKINHHPHPHTTDTSHFNPWQWSISVLQPFGKKKKEVLFGTQSPQKPFGL